MRQRREVQFGPYTIGDGHPVRVVAEIGVNHLGDYGRMKELIHAAHEAGAHALKFQTFHSSAEDHAPHPLPAGRSSDLER